MTIIVDFKMVGTREEIAAALKELVDQEILREDKSTPHLDRMKAGKKVAYTIREELFGG